MLVAPSTLDYVKKNDRVLKSLLCTLDGVMGERSFPSGFIGKARRKGFVDTSLLLNFEPFPIAYSLEVFIFHSKHTLKSDWFCFCGRFNV